MRFEALIGIIALLFMTFGCDLLTDKKHPSDSELIRNFNDHKDAFDELIRMFQADRNLGRVGAGFTRSSGFFEKCKSAENENETEVIKDTWNGKTIDISRKKYDDYQKRFADLGLTAGIEGYCEKELIHLYVSTRGLSVTGSTKGYAYLAKPPQTLVEDLDSYWSEDRRSFTAYRKIDGNWYLYFDYED